QLAPPEEKALPSNFKREDQPERLTDDQVMEMAWWADNGEKFQALWTGNWQAMGYPSQSEADMALMSMIAYYSDSDVQCLRLFRKSGLGKRDKAVKNDKYLLNETLMYIRAKQLPMVEIPSLQDLQAQFDFKTPGPRIEENMADDSTSVLSDPAQAISIPFNFSADHGMQKLVDDTAIPVLPNIVAGLPRPPGLIGEIAEYVY